MDGKVVFLLAVVFWVNLSTTGGLIYGFYSLIAEINNEVGGKGQLYQLCTATKSDGKLDCDPRDHFYANVFAVAVGCASAGTAVIGILMDKYGPKLVGILGCIIQGVGFFILRAGDSETHGKAQAQTMFMVGFSMIACGGIGPYLASYNLANLTSNPNAITSLIAALFNMAGLTFFILTKLMDTSNIEPHDQRNLICEILGGLNFIHLIVIYLLWPLQPYSPGSKGGPAKIQQLVTFGLVKSQAPQSHSDDEGSRPFLMETTDANTSKNNSLGDTPPTNSSVDRRRLLETAEGYRPLIEENGRRQICSVEWFFMTIFYCFFLLAMSFYFASINTQIDPDSKYEWRRTTVLLMANLAPVAFAFPAGYLLDKFGFALGVAGVAVCTLAMYLCLLPDDNVAFYIVSFIAFAIMRTFLFSTFFGYIGCTFGYANYGLVVGVTTVCQAGVNQISIPLNSIGFGDAGFFGINCGFAIGAALFLPYALTLGVWEWNDDQADAVFNQGLGALANLGVKATFGRRITYKWGKITHTTPRRMRSQRKLVSGAGTPEV